MKEIEEKKAKGEEVEELPDEEEEDKEEEEDEEEKEEEEPEDDEEPPTAELSETDKKVWFRKRQFPDLTEYVLNTNFSKFTLPEKQDGFEDIRYEWAKAPQSKEYLKEWVLGRKLTTRIEDIKPSVWFSQKLLEWQKSVQLWQGKVAQYKAAEERKAQEVAKKRAAAAQAAAKKAEQAEGDGSKVDGEVDEEKKDEKMEAEEPEKQESAEEEKEAEEEDAVKVDFDAIDVFGAEDVLDVGGGMPLCVNFKGEDWALMALRFELHLMSMSFRKDADDPERTGIHLDHLPFYYQKYFKKILNPKIYGVDDCAALIGLVEDALLVTSQQVIESQLPEEMETFAVLMKVAEEDRRWRKLRVAMGDEAARRNVQLTPAAAPNNAAGAPLQAVQAAHPAQSTQPVQNSIGGKPVWQSQKPLISGKAMGKGALLQGVSNAFVQSFLQTALMGSPQVGVKASLGKGSKTQSWKGGGKKGW